MMSFNDLRDRALKSPMNLALFCVGPISGYYLKIGRGNAVRGRKNRS